MSSREEQRLRNARGDSDDDDDEEEEEEEEEGDTNRLAGGSVSPATVLDSHSRVSYSVDGSLDDCATADSEEGSLVIADMQERKDSDDIERDTEHSEGSSKKGNRTCQYCGVVKPTPAALIRHVRKHTGERPFVCQQSVPTSSAAISEATKSLLRETLESSRKAKDGSNGVALSDNLTRSSKTSDRLSTPNLVNLLTSDFMKKMDQPDDVALLKGNHYLLSNTQMNSIVHPVIVKTERSDGLVGVKMEVEEQAEDLSIQKKTPKKSKQSAASSSNSDKKVHCEFCNKGFKHDVSLANHIHTAHRIIVNFTDEKQHTPTKKAKPRSNSNSGSSSKNNVKNKSNSPYTRIEPKASSSEKPTASSSKLPPYMTDLTDPKLELPTDLTTSSLLARKSRERPNPLSVDASTKGESYLGTGNSGSTATETSTPDECNALPYHVTSRLVQDLSLHELASNEADKLVLAEDGGQRKYGVTVLKETVLATRLEGINNVTGRQTTVFKCHLCRRVFSSMLRYHHHLPSHFDLEIVTFDCRYCEASFRSQVQIIKHLQCHREKFSGLAVALPLDDFQKKHKDQGDAAMNSIASVASGAGSSYLSPGYLADESMNNTPSGSQFTEPGERPNGGYACVKCRKSFSREYLLQRHMRIHQNQNSFWCPDCESGFSGKLDLLEHRKLCHGGKVTNDQMKFSNMLNSGVYDQDSFNPANSTAVAISCTPPNTKHATTSDTNNNTNSGNNNAVINAAGISGLTGRNFLPLVDMKAIDLRHGAEVAIQMAQKVGDSSRQLQAFQDYQYRALMLMKVAELSAASEKRKGLQGDDDCKRTAQKSVEAMNNRVLQENEQMKKLLEIRRNTLLEEKKRQERQEEEERDSRRQLEQQKLKAKLAKEGMGDVTVVLPAAPPPDTNAGEANMERVSELDAPAVAMDFSSTGRHACPPTVDISSRIDHVLEREYGPSPPNSKPIPSEGSSTTSSIKRPSISAGVNTGPPAKSRRKASKPKRVNHCEEEEILAGGEVKMEELVEETRGAITEEVEKNESPAWIPQSGDIRGRSVSHSPSLLAAETLSQLNQLSNLGGNAASISDTPQNLTTITESSTNIGPLISNPLSSKVTEQLIMVQANSSNVPVSTIATSTSDCGNDTDNSGAIDLSTDSNSRRDSPKSSSLANIPAGYKAYMKEMNFLTAASSTSSLLSSVSSSISSQHSNGNYSDTGLQSGTRVSEKPAALFSRSHSLDGDSTSRNDNYHLGPSSLDVSKTSLLNLQIPFPSTSSAILSKLSSDHLDPDTLVGFPRVQWKTALTNGGQSLTGKPIQAPTAALLLSIENSNSSCSIRSQGSSPSPAPSPTNSDTSSSAEGRKSTTTSLSRTHSRLSVVNEPVDRNMLCKPRVLDDGRSVYSCAICHKNFLSLSDINRHMDFHEDIRPYKCKYCDYYARTNSQLKVHKLRHEGVREFCCRICNYKGVTQSDLNRHMKSQVHVLRSQNLCEHCGEGFVTPRTLEDHQGSFCYALSPGKISFKCEEDYNGTDDEADIMDDDEALPLNMSGSSSRGGNAPVDVDPVAV